MADSIFNLDAIRKAFNNVTGKPLNAAPITKPSTTTSSATATVSPSVIQTAANNVKKTTSTVPSSSNITAAAQKMASTVPSSSSSSTTPRTEQTLNNLSSLVNKDWQYDSNSDQALQAAIKQAQAQLAVNQKNTNAQLMATGQGKSSYSETVANQLANQASESIANDLIPTYAAQAYQQYQDSITNNQNLYNLQYNQDYTTAFNESDRTGIYQSPEVKNALNAIMEAKQTYENPNSTAEQRAAAHQMAEYQRKILANNNVDASSVGADVNSKNVNTSGIGIRTLAGQSQDLQSKQANLNAAATYMDATGKVMTPTTDWSSYARQAADSSTPLTAAQTQQNWENSYNQNQFNESVRQYNQDNANTQSYQNAQLALAQDDNSRAWAQLDYDQSQSTSGTQGMTANQLLDSMKSLYSEPVLDSNGTDTGKTKITTNSTKRTQMFESVVDAGLSDTETKQVLLSLGFTSSEINNLIKSYSGE